MWPSLGLHNVTSVSVRRHSSNTGARSAIAAKSQGLSENHVADPFPALKVMAEEAVAGAKERRAKRTDSREDDDRRDSDSKDNDVVAS